MYYQLSRVCLILLLLSLCIPSTLYSQTIPLNKYGARVVESVDFYKETVEKNGDKQLVDLEKYIPGIVLDIKYATPDNFTKQTLYSQPKAFARLPVAESLRKIQAELGKKGLGLKIFDTYRPYRYTVFMWNLIQNPMYVASPKSGSRHNRGCAVDLTLIELATGKELEMPTPYDDFTVKAHHTHWNLPKKAIENRSLLKTVMEKYGFTSMQSEWWHYDFKGFQKYELLDITFEQLAKLTP